MTHTYSNSPFAEDEMELAHLIMTAFRTYESIIEGILSYEEYKRIGKKERIAEFLDAVKKELEDSTMNYLVIGKRKDEKIFSHEYEYFDTIEEAETFIGKEGTQMEAQGVHFEILKTDTPIPDDSLDCKPPETNIAEKKADL